MRHGFTLVETVVALVLVQFGLLAVAALSAVAVREVASATRMASARDAARERVERLRPRACAEVTEGSESTPAMTEHWSVRGDSVLRLVRDSVELRLPAGRRAQIVIEQAVLCG